MNDEKQYDDTDRGAMFPPRENNVLVGQGKLNSNGVEEYHVMVKATLPSGKIIREIYKKVGVLFENDNANPKAPHLSGDYEDRRLAVWFATSQAGKDYMDLKVGDKTPMSSPIPAYEGPNEYEQAKQGVTPVGKIVDQVINNVIEGPDGVDEIPF
jgi:hypothetical protein